MSRGLGDVYKRQKDKEIEISGSVLIEDKNSQIKGKIIKFNMASEELKIN